MQPEAVVVIPARLASHRFPGKLLADVGGEPLVVHVARRAAQAKRVGATIVATADSEIAEVALAHGCDVVRTSRAPRNGTERVWEVAEALPFEHVINVQGDEALVDPRAIDEVARGLSDGHPIVTLACPASDEEVGDPNRVKVVCDPQNRALYFSRAAIPNNGPWRRHLGIYGYQRAALKSAAALPPGALESSEGLEQLRWLENGIPIHIVDVDDAPPPVDTPLDLDRVRALLSAP